MGGKEVQATVTLEAGRAYLLTLELAKSEAVPLGAIHLGCLPPEPADTIERAVALAAAAVADATSVARFLSSTGCGPDGKPLNGAAR